MAEPAAILGPDKAGSIGPDDHLILVDGSAYIFRAYHALPPLTRSTDGMPVGAVSGFCTMLHKLVDDALTGKEEHRPSHIAVIFDPPGGSFRNQMYDLYKANRDAPPEDLVPQFPLVRDATRAFSLPAVELKGYEADDLIATYAKAAEAQGASVTIFSSDKDLMQLVTDKVTMVDPMKNKRIDPDGVVEKFGVGPDRVVDVQALAGDSADNVPGVPGIGIKTAALLINEYGDLDTLLARAGEIKQPKRRENLLSFADQARLSRDLVRLAIDAPVDDKMDEFHVENPDPDTLLGFLTAMEFRTLTKRIAGLLGVEAPAVASKNTAKKRDAAPAAEIGDGGQPGAQHIAVEGAIDPDSYECVTTLDRLQHWIDVATKQGYVAVDTETTGLDAMQVDLVGVSLATAPGVACYIPLAHKGADGDGLALTDDTPEQIDFDQALGLLKPMLEDEGILKIGQNLKYDMLLLRRYGITVSSFDDTMLLSYALDGGKTSHGMDTLAGRHLDHATIPFKEVAGTGKKQLTFDQVPLDAATRYAGEDADVTLRLWAMLKPRLAGEHMARVYEGLERPLVSALLEMEGAGVKVDRDVLARLSARFADKMASLETQIHELAGEQFNIGSPKQLGEILFDKMGIEGGKKTKTGAWATPHDVLEGLAAQGHELPAKVLDWRGVQKLKSTYTDALPNFINPNTGRIHTSYSMAAASTGRLASTDPNLQNIPIRTEEGREIRTAFVAEPGHVLMSADYSQIELRLLAHIADIETLQTAFHDGLDIHAMTASEVFGVPIEGMDPMVRRKAKAINFGIVYGISAFGLANQLGIGRGEASNYIDAYFEKFPGIRAYMNDTKEFAREHGFVETCFGRKIHLPEINAKNGAQRSFMERAAINAPIQGSAADVIRRAMIRMPDALRAANLKTRMLLQVHDELVFEVPENEVAHAKQLVTDIMQNAADPAMTLSVPLTVEAGIGQNWQEAH